MLLMKTTQIGISILKENLTTNNHNLNWKTNDPHSNYHKQSRKIMSIVAKLPDFSIPLFVHRNIRCTELVIAYNEYFHEKIEVLKIRETNERKSAFSYTFASSLLKIPNRNLQFKGKFDQNTQVMI